MLFAITLLIALSHHAKCHAIDSAHIDAYGCSATPLRYAIATYAMLPPRCCFFSLRAPLMLLAFAALKFTHATDSCRRYAATQERHTDAMLSPRYAIHAAAFLMMLHTAGALDDFHTLFSFFAFHFRRYAFALMLLPPRCYAATPCYAADCCHAIRY